MTRDDDVTEHRPELSVDEALVLDCFAHHARMNGPQSVLSSDALLERTELTRRTLTEVIEALEAAGHVEVRWNHNGTFTATLAPHS